MGDFLSKELSTSNKWWLPKYRYLELRYFALQYPWWKKEYAEMGDGLVSKTATDLYLNGSKLADRTAELAIRRKGLSDKMIMVEQAAVEADSELYSYILKAVTEGATFVALKALYQMPCERDMFYDRRRKFYWLLSKKR